MFDRIIVQAVRDNVGAILAACAALVAACVGFSWVLFETDLPERLVVALGCVYLLVSLNAVVTMLTVRVLRRARRQSASLAVVWRVSSFRLSTVIEASTLALLLFPIRPALILVIPAVVDGYPLVDAIRVSLLFTRGVRWRILPWLWLPVIAPTAVYVQLVRPDQTLTAMR